MVLGGTEVEGAGENNVVTEGCVFATDLCDPFVTTLYTWPNQEHRLAYANPGTFPEAHHVHVYADTDTALNYTGLCKGPSRYKTGRSANRSRTRCFYFHLSYSHFYRRCKRQIYVITLSTLLPHFSPCSAPNHSTYICLRLTADLPHTLLDSWQARVPKRGHSAFWRG